MIASEVREMLSFIDGNPTAYHTTAAVRDILLKAGFAELLESRKWALEPGKDYFVCRNGSSIIAFRMGDQLENYSFNVAAAHTDSPCFRIKENAEIHMGQNYTKLNTEGYGGMICATWMDRPLSVAGRVLVQENGAIVSRLVALDRDLLMIPSVAIHMNREVNDKASFNKQVDMLPVLGGACEEGALKKLIAEELKVSEEQILGSDLFLYVREKATVWGCNEEFISCGRLDDQQCVYGILLLGCYIASLGLNPLKKLLTAAGTCTFVMSLLYIVMMFAAPAINPTAEYVHANLSFSSLIPNFNVTYFTSLSILVFAVGGCEKISPYVNKVENPSKGFPRGMIALAVMVVTCAILGTLAMSRMFDPAVINASAESFNAYVANSSYWAFQKLGQYYHVGDLFMIIYALCNVISQLAVLILSIDAPLRMLLDNEHTKQFIPQALHKVNAHGVHSNGIKMVAVLSGSIILAQSFVPGAAAVLRQLTKLNSVCMPMRYLWVFAAYIALRNAYDTIPAEYRFVKNQAVAKFFGGWCFAVTAVCCVLGMYDKDPFTFALNVITPVVLTVLGFILPALAKREQTAAKK